VRGDGNTTVDKAQYDPLDESFSGNLAYKEEALRKIFKLLDPDPLTSEADISVLDWTLISQSSAPRWAGRGLKGATSEARFVEVYLSVYAGSKGAIGVRLTIVVIPCEKLHTSPPPTQKTLRRFHTHSQA